MTGEDVRRFQIEQRDARADHEQHRLGAALPLRPHARSPDLARKLYRFPHHRRPPLVVLSPDGVARLLQATTCLKHRAMLSVAYGAGLRVSEVGMLKVRDVDSERMLLRVEKGKGGQVSQRHALRRSPRAA
ncbi:MAG TPA: tyrosine-type recombinase/integrase [Hyphomicrobiaceae bacterium]|nr:tyrosine-type recombinase/integrase [Hyphomicrobiaceae bacterium]